MTTKHPLTAKSEDWLAEARHGLPREAALFVRTFAAFLFRPGRSAHEWQTGRRMFMNPLGFAATAAGAYWALMNVLAALWPIPGSEAGDSLGEQFSAAVGPYLHYLLLGLAMHAGLRLLGSRHSLVASLGAALLAGGSIGTLTAAVLTAVARWVGHARGTPSLELHAGDAIPLALLVASLTSYALLCFAIARALTALHRTESWKMALAAASAVAVTAFLFGSVLPDGAYGWRPYIQIDLNGRIAMGFRG